MATITTEGIVLKRRDFGEADRVLTALTKQHGKISIIARGVRRITSRRAGNIELLNRVKLHLFKAKNYTLTEAEAIETFPRLKSNITLSTTAFHIIELVDRLVAENQINPFVYDLTVTILKILEKNPRQIFIRSFEVKLLSLLGFWSPNAIHDLSDETRKLLTDLEQKSWGEINQIRLNEAKAQNLEMLMRSFIEKTIESNLKSVQVMKKIKL
ncbi:MAG: repair protein RecO protein [Candidatus Daviesbacteria bacterium GW2011_GWA2_38_24]|uniref:DNA repair protein RecO n=1 Tax=Candidatus Daviesbacteria bacterium GW2011_GWA2_38_24 TaxID=1618422 RepID=A0A0G0JHM3_9BACT|nr:MAG: repair protein RecO protein [Candidatus Daviesbacteria bacterium GW2011_GWA2_38_24]KKQ80527.1 MAG: repair protein RecO protein [Candidatus Daviesbacteria bacterium GW2011_GWA1_38_7]OGE23315.1 MAG: DNA repair protein RecO [Candidatus Daviesbacteria bacterium RIFCSPHIGHO2_01_FULL_38_8]